MAEWTEEMIRWMVHAIEIAIILQITLSVGLTHFLYFGGTNFSKPGLRKRRVGLLYCEQHGIPNGG